MSFIVSFVFGAVFGSFISVIVHRLKTDPKGIFLGRSECPNCNTRLGFWDLFPIFSYIFLKGKCRYCGEKISIIYPILELVSGLIFVFTTYLITGNQDMQSFVSNINFIVYAWLITIFIIALSFYDILFLEISFSLAIILGILILIPQLFGFIGDFKTALLLGIVGFVAFVSIIFLREKIRKKEGMGGGDALGAILVGFLTPIIMDLLGIHYNIWLSFYVIILLGFFLGAVFGIPTVLLQKKDGNFMLPFLPFMFLAIVVFSLFGKQILHWVIG